MEAPKESFEFSAPQYLNQFDVATLNSDGSDSFFDADSDAADETAAFKTPRREPNEKVAEREEDKKEVEKEVDGDLQGSTEEEVLAVRATPGKKHSMVTRLDVVANTPVIELRSRQVVIMPLPQNNGTRKRKAYNSPDLSGVKFQVGASFVAEDTTWAAPPKSKKMMTLAEEIFHFHKDTPPRFRRQWKTEGPPNCNFQQLLPTKPQTPKLATRLRARRNHCLEEITEKSPSVPQVSKIKISHQEQMQNNIKHSVMTNIKQEETDQNEPFIFKAKPVPKSTYSRARDNKEHLRRPSSVESLVVPHGGKRRRLSGCNRSSTIYDRGLSMLQKKEEKIKLLKIDEESKWEFHANPLPSYLHISPNSMATSILSSASRHTARCDASTPIKPAFKAKFPAVLYKAPFVPEKASGDGTRRELKEISLNTERRARERQVFDNKLKEKHELLEKLKQEPARSTRSKQPRWAI